MSPSFLLWPAVMDLAFCETAARRGAMVFATRSACRQFNITDAGDATRRIHREAGRAVAVQFACTEESPGSAEQDAG